MGLGGFFKKVGRTVGKGLGVAAPFLPFIPGVGPLAAAGAGLAGKLLAGRGGGQAQGAGGGGGDYNNRFESALTGGLQRGQALEDDYLNRMRDFDPTAGFAEQTEAELAAQDEGFARNYASGLGRMVGGGRLPTKSGFGLQTAQDMVLQGQRERAAIQQRNAAGAGAARAQHLDRMGAYASGMQNRYFDALTGRMNTVEAQRLQDAASKRGMAGNILGGAIGAIPDIVSLFRRNPAGA